MRFWGIRRDTKAAVVVVALFLLLAVAAIGCGGSSDPEPLSKSAFVEQANAICGNYAKEQKQVGEEVVAASESADPSEEAVAGTEKLVAPVKTMTDELSDLGPPKGDEKEVAAIIGAFEAGAAQLEAEPGGPDSVSAFDKANALATSYGLSDCTICTPPAKAGGPQ